MGQVSTVHSLYQAMALLPYVAVVIIGVMVVRRYLMKLSRRLAAVRQN